MSSDTEDQMRSGVFNVENKYTRILLNITQNLERYLIYVFYVFLLFVVISEVFRRYALNMSSFWSGETARYSFLYITYLGISWAAYKRTHIRIDILMDRVSHRAEDYMYLFSNIIMLIFGAYAIWYTIPIIETSLEFNAQTQALGINRAFAQIAIPIGFSLMMIRIVQRTYYDIRDIRAGEPVFKGENVFIDDDSDEGGW